MKISNIQRDEKISKFANKYFEAPLFPQKYIKYYEVFVDDDEIERFTLEDILLIAENVGPDFKILIHDVEVDMQKFTKDVRKTTDAMIRSIMKPKINKKKK